jgi:hypothetical protein
MTHAFDLAAPAPVEDDLQLSASLPKVSRAEAAALVNTSEGVGAVLDPLAGWGVSLRGPP